MKKISYTNIKSKFGKDILATKNFTFHDMEIEVLQYLPIQDKYGLVMTVLERAKENNIFNVMKLDMYFNLFIACSYINLSLTDKQKENEDEIYDILHSSGLLDQIIDNIPENEYNILYEYLIETKEQLERYNGTFSAVINTFMEELPKNTEKAENLIKNFNESEFKEIIELAKLTGFQNNQFKK